MWIVRLARRRPLSVAVMALLMLVLGRLSFAMMNMDIFPAINLTHSLGGLSLSPAGPCLTGLVVHPSKRHWSFYVRVRG